MNIEKDHTQTASSIPECTNYLFRTRYILPRFITSPSRTIDKYFYLSDDRCGISRSTLST